MSQGRAPEQRGSLVGSRLTAWVAAGFLPAIGALFLPVAQASGSDAWLGVAPVAASAHSAPLDRTGSSLLGLQVAGVGILAAATVVLAGRRQAAKGDED